MNANVCGHIKWEFLPFYDNLDHEAINFKSDITRLTFKKLICVQTLI
jgi:hypothetical protein